MNKIYLLIFLFTSIVSTLKAQYLKTERFNNDDLPSNWTLQSTNTTNTWEIATSTPFDSNAAFVSNASQTQNEKLITPEVDFYYAEEPTLKFKLIANPNARLSVRVIYNEGMHSAEVWNIEEETISGDEAHDIEVDLSEFLGEYVNISFQYEGGGEVYIDDVSIAEPDYVENDDRYCYYSGLNQTMPITYVGLQEISNRTSAVPGGLVQNYYLDQKAYLAKGQTYPLTLEGNTDNKKNSFTIFIDWNQNGYFTDENEVIFAGTLENSTGEDGKQLVVNIPVPLHAKLGETRIRIVKLSSDLESISACNSGSKDGEVEDYTLVINNVEFCEVNLQSSEPITSVKVEDFENTSSNDLTSNVYEDFTSQTIVVEQASTKVIEIKANTNGNFTNSISAFIDFNRNGIFDEDERFDLGKITNSTGSDNQKITSTITIPDYAVIGNTTMRIIKINSDNYLSNVCDLSNFKGQVEDYTINIISGDCIKGTESDGVENGHANISSSLIANDFKVEANKSFNLSRLHFDFLLQDEPESANITIYEDNNGQPGNVVKSFENLESSGLEYFDSGIGPFQLVRTNFDLPSSVELNGNEAGQTFWISVKLNSETTSALSATQNMNSQYVGLISEDNGQTWNNLPGSGEWDGVFTLYSSCYLSNDDIINSSNTYKVDFYPNPVENILNIKSQSKIQKVEIYNFAGQRVLTKKVNNLDQKIQLNGLASGIYIVNVSTEKGTESFKIIKK